MTNSRTCKRPCKRCGSGIVVGKGKIGRAVFPGGICFRCWMREAGKKKKRTTAPAPEGDATR